MSQRNRPKKRRKQKLGPKPAGRPYQAMSGQSKPQKRHINWKLWIAAVAAAGTLLAGLAACGTVVVSALNKPPVPITKVYSTTNVYVMPGNAKRPSLPTTAPNRAGSWARSGVPPRE